MEYILLFQTTLLLLSFTTQGHVTPVTGVTCLFRFGQQVRSTLSPLTMFIFQLNRTDRVWVACAMVGREQNIVPLQATHMLSMDIFQA